MWGARREGTLTELARVFLWLGATSFGGPAAHLAVMEQELVRRRGWLTHQQFLDFIGAANLIPGPNSTEVALHVGWHRRGWPGLVVAGVSFIGPAAVLVTLIGAFYVRYGSLPSVRGVLYGVKPVVVVIVAQAAWRLAKGAVGTRRKAIVAGLAAVAVVLGVNELAVLLGAGLAMAGLAMVRQRQGRSAIMMWMAAGPVAMTTAPVTVGVVSLFWVFLKIGAVLYGGGYVLVSLLRAELVTSRGWLTETQLLDAVAVGQFTPGPLFTTAGFVGYLLGGTAGAWAALVAIFLPGFVLVGLSGPLIPRLRSSAAAGAFLDGVNAASWSLIGIVAVQLAGSAVVDGLTIWIALLSVGALMMTKINSTWLLLAAALAGLLIGGAAPGNAAEWDDGVRFEGRVTYAGELPDPVPNPEAGTKRALVVVDGESGGLKDVVVWLDRVEGRKVEPVLEQDVDEAVMDQRDFTFQPHVLAVRAGRMVEFRNSDVANHGVRAASLQPENAFNVTTPPGGSHRHRFVASKSPVAIGCPIHSAMAGWIFVFDHPDFAVTDEAGRFVIEGVSPGRYRLEVRHPSGGMRTSREVVIEADQPEPVEIRFEEEDLGITPSRAKKPPA